MLMHTYPYKINVILYNLTELQCNIVLHVIENLSDYKRVPLNQVHNLKHYLGLFLMLDWFSEIF